MENKTREKIKQRDKIFTKNKNLIEYWHSIPFWQFWKKPSFEERRQIILNNWKQLEENEE